MLALLDSYAKVGSKLNTFFLKGIRADTVCRTSALDPYRPNNRSKNERLRGGWFS
jgi:hypothetical protein